MNLKRATVGVGLPMLIVGFAGGLLLSGDPTLTAPSTAGSDQGRAVVMPVAAPAAAALPDLSAVAEAALKVSANITSTTVIQPPADPWSRLWFGDRAQESQSLGSGVVVSPDGYVLTNTHVIGNAGAQILVTLPDGSEQPAKLIGIDEVSDLAVVKVSGSNLPTLPWGSTKLRVAEWVLAIGNPFQLSGTVTLGIVSTVSRPGAQVGQYSNFIQTDAAINPGNSGGALVNARGELIGINTLIVAPTGGNQGLGFAIPSDLARTIMGVLIEQGALPWGSIGDIVWRTMSPGLARRANLTVGSGALAYSMPRSSSAYRAGLRAGDIVVGVNGQPITDAEQLDRIIIDLKPGTTLRAEIVQQSGGRRTLQIPVVSRSTARVPA